MRKVKRVEKEAGAAEKGRRKRMGSEKRARPAPTPSRDGVVSATAAAPGSRAAEPRSVRLLAHEMRM
uniref:Uncharacterized protein n=1 Tax=Arundo donax TaxID=35708 RepID=A0A0A8YMR9_ARUDO